MGSVEILELGCPLHKYQSPIFDKCTLKIYSDKKIIHKTYVNNLPTGCALNSVGTRVITNGSYITSVDDELSDCLFMGNLDDLTDSLSEDNVFGLIKDICNYFLQCYLNDVKSIFLKNPKSEHLVYKNFNDSLAILMLSNLGSLKLYLINTVFREEKNENTVFNLHYIVIILKRLLLQPRTSNAGKMFKRMHQCNKKPCSCQRFENRFNDYDALGRLHKMFFDTSVGIYAKMRLLQEELSKRYNRDPNILNIIVMLQKLEYET